MHRHLSVLATITTAGAFVLLMLSGCDSPTADDEVGAGVRYIQPDSATGIAAAAVVGNVPLAHTNQIFPYDSEGNITGRGDVAAQTGQVITNLDAALQGVGADLSGIVRLHVYVRDDAQAAAVMDRLRDVFPGNILPPVALMSGELPEDEADVAMDAVAAAGAAGQAEQIEMQKVDGIWSADDQASVAVLPPGPKIFLSGQAHRAEDLEEATTETMRGLLATLAYLGSSVDDIVQVKAFSTPVAKTHLFESTIASFFPPDRVPPIVTVEWYDSGIPTEIELVAASRTNHGDSDGQGLRYLAPPWTNQASTFSRVVEAPGSSLVYVSGLYGEPGGSGEDEVRGIFARLSSALEEAGSGYDQLAKSTYYFSTDEASQALNDVRPEFYDPATPPASSKISVQGVGRPGATVSFDMIGIVSD